MKTLISRLVALVVIAAVAFTGWELFFRKPSESAPSKSITVTGETTINEIAETLKEASVISSSAIFSAVAKLSGDAKNLRPGIFIFKEGMSVTDALRVLGFVGKKEITVTIPEGLDLRQIADRLVAAGILKTREEFFTVTGEPAKRTIVSATVVQAYPILADKPADVSLEGYLFPDTYRFYADATAEEVVRRMLDNLTDKTQGLTADESFHEILTMASIVEAEVKTDVDRKLVADILYRRIEARMPLQVDSSVNYVTGKSDPSVTNADAAVDSPWNTYKYRGLPPGPISNPGLSSINAALTPTPNSYWFFLTTKDGTVIYSKTAAQHGAAKAKYLQ